MNKRCGKNIFLHVVVVVYHVTIVAMDMGCRRNFGLFGNRLRYTHCREFLYVKLYDLVL